MRGCAGKLNTRELWSIVNYLRSLGLTPTRSSLKIVVADDLPDSAIESAPRRTGLADRRAQRPPRRRTGPRSRRRRRPARSQRHQGDRRPARRRATAADRRPRRHRRRQHRHDAASGRGILVVNAPGANSISVAEQAFALMLSLARSVPAADRAMKDGKWEKKRFVGTELRGKTLGIAGLGRIGQEVAVRARSFGMRIVAHDPFISQDIAAGVGAELLSLDDLFADGRLRDAAPAVDACHQTSAQRRAVRPHETGHPDHQHGPRRSHRRGGAAPRHRAGHRRRRRARRLREGAAGRLGARAAAAGRGDAAYRGVDRGSPGTGRPRHGRGGARLSARRPGAQRRQLSVGSSRRAPAPAAVDPAGRTTWRHRRADGRRARSRRSALRYYGALAETRAADILGIERGGRGCCGRFCRAASPS